MVLKDVGGSETHEMSILPDHLETRMSDGQGCRAESASANQGTNPEQMPPNSQDEGAISIFTLRHVPSCVITLFSTSRRFGKLVL